MGISVMLFWGEKKKSIFVIIFYYEAIIYLYNLHQFISLTQRGVFLQINLLSLIGYYSKEVQDKAENLIANNMVRFIGSDCHNMKHVELYKKCQTRRAWHNLHNSGKLLNSTL